MAPMADLRSKFKKIVSSHEQMKTAFHQLKSQIKFGLLEAEDVFASLSMPLMSLVGLKSVEMAQEGRFSTIVVQAEDSFQGCRRNELRSETVSKSSSTVYGADQIHGIHKFEEQDESYVVRAAMAGKQLREKQHLQLTQLVHLLRQIETQVNTSQDGIIQTLAYHRVSLQSFFQRAISYISALHCSGQNQNAFIVTLKLFRIAFEHVGAALGSVESGVDALMHELAEHMCNPMVEYVKGLKAEMTTGTCQHLLAMVEEMVGVMRDGRLELEEARKKMKVAEERKLEALSRLTESEERVKTMRAYFGSLLEDNKNSVEASVPHKFVGGKEDQGKDEKQMWELLKQKRKRCTPDSPLGGEGLLLVQPTNKARKLKRVSHSISHRPVTRSYSRGIDPRSPLFNSCLLPLGLSPSSATNQQQLMSPQAHYSLNSRLKW